MYEKPCRKQFIFSGTPDNRQPADNETRTTERTRRAKEKGVVAKKS
jgi:hypothetical protein